jgi:hypothetical protein
MFLHQHGTPRRNLAILNDTANGRTLRQGNILTSHELLARYSHINRRWHTWARLQRVTIVDDKQASSSYSGFGLNMLENKRSRVLFFSFLCFRSMSLRLAERKHTRHCLTGSQRYRHPPYGAILSPSRSQLAGKPYGPRRNTARRALVLSNVRQALPRHKQYITRV